MKRRLVIFILLTNIHFGYSIYFKQIGTKDGLSQISVISIYQDILGRMWFGTEEGLNIYDGKSMTTYQPFDHGNQKPLGSIYGNRVQPITGDNQGNVFFKVDNAVMRYDIRKQKFELLRKDNVTALSSWKGEIWIAVGDTIYKWDEKKNTFVYTLKTNFQEGVQVLKIYWDKKERLWLGTTNGLYRNDSRGHFHCIIPNDEIYEIYESRSGDIWVGTRMDGLYRIDRENNIAKYIHEKDDPNSIVSNQIREFVEDDYGNLWFGTFKGLHKYNPNTDHFLVYQKDNLSGGLSHSSVFSLFLDNQGTIWVGTYYGGVNYFNPEADVFTYYAEDEHRNDCLNYPFVGNMVEDNSGNIWICTEGGGLNLMDRKTRLFRYFTSDKISNSLAHNNLKCIAYDLKRNKLYIGTHTGGLSCYNIATGRFTNYLDTSGKREASTISNTIINDIAIYDDKLYFLSSKKGLMVIDLETNLISPIYSDKNNKKLYMGAKLMIDSKGRLWLAQNNGIIRFNLKDPSRPEFFANGQDGYGQFKALKILETKNKQIYIGTEGGGLFLFDEKNLKFIRFTAENDQLLSNYCYNLAESSMGYLIVTSDRGISFFDSAKDITKQVTLEGFPINSINSGCGLQVCRNGEILVGGADGLVSFFEEDLYKNKQDYNLYFTDLYIDNEKVYPNDKNKVLTSGLAFTKKLDLSYNQNNLIFTFTTNNYVGSLQKANYEYMLDGFDKDWIKTDLMNIYYTNLNPGSYVLKVREKDVYSHQYLREIQLSIKINTPYYATIWAYLLYILLFSIIIYSIIRSRRSKIKLAFSLEKERKDKETMEELNHAKLLFFTNISHEFRTPLTLIISQIDLLLQKTSLSPSVYNKVLRIYKNAYQMRNLINELLDFRKLEQQYVTLKVGEANLIEFLKEIYLSFYEYASAHSISYQFESRDTSLLCWFDSEQLQKVFYNMLSNAFKYTKQGGRIELTVSQTENEIFVNVIDNGIGIESGELERIFDSFYQVRKGDGLAALGGRLGTGMGLSISKSIIELHHGSISVESHPGYGSIFNVNLKKGRAHFEHDGSTLLDHTEKNAMKPDTFPDPVFMERMLEVPSPIFQESEKGNRPTIVIVEDKEELLQILFSLFSPLYNVVLARNGEEGLQKVMEIKPDIVLSDVMMPVMSGTVMCLHIKSNIELSHIPVVLLTALTSAEQNVEGLQRGADDYIEKPFNAKVLLTRCNNLIRSRLLFQKRLNANLPDFDVQLLANNTLDKKFLERVDKIILQNLDNAIFDINMLARELAMSRSSLFSKFKALTGLTPNDYILKDKLKRAASLLKNNPELQIAEISDRLGFSSARYFSRCFKLQFNISPLEYRKK